MKDPVMTSHTAQAPNTPDRRTLLRGMALAVPALGAAGLAGCASAGSAGGTSGVTSKSAASNDWQRHASPEAAGFSSAKLKVMEAALYPMETSALMIVKGGKIAWSYGDLDVSSYLASARKSIVSMLYGKYVENGTINLDRTMGDLGIDDIGVLTAAEKTATVRDLLTARSGVFHPPGSPGSTAGAPARGAHPRGSYFYYNNWDFNVVGAVFEKLTGKTIFAAFRDELAVPMQMQDFDFSRQRMLGYKPARSQYGAYHFFLSCRDMARLGVLVASGGKWNGQQLVSANWVREMTTTRVTPAQTRMDFGYAYLWWKPGEVRTAPAWRDSSLALGNYGQNILVMPAHDVVVVHRRYVTDEFAIARNLGETQIDKVGVSNDQFMKVCDLMVAAMA